MKPRLMLFDVDGTLVDTAGAGRRAIERACKELFGIDRIEFKARGVSYAGRTDPIILEAVAEAIGIDGGRLDASLETLRESYLASLRVEMQRDEPEGRVLPGVRTLLETLEGRDDVHMGLLTGNFETGARIKLEPFDLNRFFPTGGFSSDHRDRRRIAHVAWRKASDHAGIEFGPDEVYVIGDTEHDVDCARANGFQAVAVDSGWVSRESLERAGPDSLLDDLGHQPSNLRALGLE